MLHPKNGTGGTTERGFRGEDCKWKALRSQQASKQLLATLIAAQTRDSRFQTRLEASIIRLVIRSPDGAARPRRGMHDVASAIAYLLDEKRLYRLRDGGDSKGKF